MSENGRLVYSAKVYSDSGEYTSGDARADAKSTLIERQLNAKGLSRFSKRFWPYAADHLTPEVLEIADMLKAVQAEIEAESEEARRQWMTLWEVFKNGGE